MARQSGRDSVFLDTGYVLALVNPDDLHHTRAVRAAKALASSAVRRATTEAILVEIGNSLSRGRRRPLGVQTIRLMRNDSLLDITPVDTALLDRAIELYASRLDKDWGLTDCISFTVMHSRKITRVLTTDEHFAQAGFEIAL